MRVVNNCEKGRSMIEMLGVLAIVGVLSVGGIAGYSKAMAKHKNIKLIEQINMLNTNIRTLFAQQKDFAGLNVAAVIAAGIAPTNMQNPTASGSGSISKLIHAWSGEIVITPAMQDEAGDNRSFLIFADNIPKEACLSLVTADWGEGRGASDLVAIMVVNNERDTDIIYEKLNVPNTEISGDKSSGRWGIFSHESSQKWRLPATVETATEACDYDNRAIVAWKYN